MNYQIPPRLPVTNSGHPDVPTTILTADQFEGDKIASLELIREYTKTDDVPHVTDEQLRLYRKAAIEAAELYTGLLLSGQRVITEPVKRPNALKLHTRKNFTHRLDHPVADGMVYLFGGVPGGERAIRIAPGSTTIIIPPDICSVDLSSCCSPCGGEPLGPTLSAMYKAGFLSVEQIPSGIILGVLKFIAWSIQNPGDVMMTVRNTEQSNATGIVGTNNGAWASGAIEQWRMYVRGV